MDFKVMTNKFVRLLIRKPENGDSNRYYCFRPGRGAC